MIDLFPPPTDSRVCRDRAGSRVARLAGESLARIAALFESDDPRPWVVAFSGGKDSTLLLHLTWLALRAATRPRPVYIVSNDTRVESPFVTAHLYSCLDSIRQAAVEEALPLSIRITRPITAESFWVCLIGKGYPPPNRVFRWCTKRLKIVPTGRAIAGIGDRGRVLLVGTRRAESQGRARRMDARELDAWGLTPYPEIKDCSLFAPIGDWDDEAVWTYLQTRDAPWGGTHDSLIRLYQDSKGSECPLVLSKAEAPSCGAKSPRFGCWTCTVVKKDKSLAGLADAPGYRPEEVLPLIKFRDWLVRIREDQSLRLPFKAGGRVKRRDDGTLKLGSFTLTARKMIFNRIESVERELGKPILSNSERMAIKWWWGEHCGLYGSFESGVLNAQNEFFGKEASNV